MKVERLEILNFCQHRQRAVDFRDGLTAIIGPNGSGKSNFLGAIRLGFTGADTNVGVKTDNISQLAGSSERSFVRLTFSHQSTRAVVTRNLRPARPTATLEIDGQPTIEGDVKVTAKIMELLGIDTSVLNDIVIVAQSAIFGFLDKTPAKRAEAFQQIFRTTAAQSLYEVMGKHLKQLGHTPANIAGLDALRAELAQCQQTSQAQAAVLANYPTFEKITEGRDSNARVVQQFQQRAELEQQRARTQTAVFDLDTQKQSIAINYNARKRDLEQKTTEYQQGEASATEARVALANLAQVLKVEQARQQLFAQREQVNQAMQAVVPLTLPDDYVEDGLVTGQEVANLTASLTSDEKFVNSFADGRAQCPTCGTRTEQLIGHLEQARQRIPELRQKLQATKARHEACIEYRKQREGQQYWRREREAQLQQIEQQLQALPEATTVEGSPEALQDLVDSQLVRQSTIRQLQEVIRSYEQQMSNADGQIQQLRARLEQLDQQINLIPPWTQEDCNQASKNVTDWDQAGANRRQWEQAQAVADTRAQHLTSQLAAQEAQAARARMLNAWIEQVDTMRGLMHYDGAPKFVIHRNLQRLAPLINQSLELFQTDYRISATEGWSFMAHFHDGRTQPAERLSVGQQVVLALAYRLALNLHLAVDISALYLDEPTAYLDEHHIRGFEPVLTRLREFAASHRLQCFMITHEQSLAPLFDSVVRL